MPENLKDNHKNKHRFLKSKTLNKYVQGFVSVNPKGLFSNQFQEDLLLISKLIKR